MTVSIAMTMTMTIIPSSSLIPRWTCGTVEWERLPPEVKREIVGTSTGARFLQSMDKLGGAGTGDSMEAVAAQGKS